MTDEEFPRLLKRYKNQLNRFDLEALTTAVTAVYKLEREFSGDPNKIAAAIMKAHPKISAKPSREEICALRCAELAKFYSRVSDGNAGVDQNAKVVDFTNIIQTLYGTKKDRNPCTYSSLEKCPAGTLAK